jgi:N-acetylmuramoyl-L-alanine amidase
LTRSTLLTVFVLAMAGAAARASEPAPAGPPAAAQPTSFCRLARSAGHPQIAGLKIAYLAALGDPTRAHKWTYILVHQTEGPAGSARNGAHEQAKNPTRRGVMLWVEVDGTVYWAVPETAIPTQGDGANRNDNKYVDNAKTFHKVLKFNSIGIEFAGNYPDVTKQPNAEQKRAGLLLIRFVQERYRIPPENIYAHNWIDFKDARYCEGCALATAARKLNFVPSGPDCRAVR